MCGGGDVPPPPPPAPEQSALQREQLSLLQTQAQQQTAFMSAQANQAGYDPVYGNDPRQVAIFKRLDEVRAGREGFENAETAALVQQLRDLGYSGGGPPSQVIVGYQKSSARATQDQALLDLQTQQMATAKKANDALNKYLDSLDTDDYKAYQKAQQDLQAQQTQIALQQGERTQKALKGELPLSEGTIQRKAQDFQLLKENLARGGNAVIGDDPSSAYSLSSPGEQALKEFNTRYASVEDQERRGALDSGTSAYLQAVGLSGNLGKSDLQTVGQLSNPGGYAATSTSLNPGISPVQNNLNLVQGYSSAMTPYLQMQQLQNSNNQMNAQIAAQDRAGWLQLGGTVLGAAGGAAMVMSSRKMKKNIEPVASEKDATLALAQTPVYRWNYKHEPEGYKRHLGTMTDEAPDDVVTDDGDHLDIASYLGLVTLSARDLHQRVVSLEGRAA